MVFNQRGMALLSVVMVLAVLLILAHVLAGKIWQSSRQTGKADTQERVFWAAQAGIEIARQALATSYANSRGWRYFLAAEAALSYPETPAWVSTVNGIPVEIFLRDNPDGDDDPHTDSDLKIFVLVRARDAAGAEAMVESLCGFEIASAQETGQQAAGDIFVDLSALPASTYDIAD